MRDRAQGGNAGYISPQALGIVCIIAAATIFSIQDMAIKWLSGGYPLHEIIFIRASVAMAITLGLLVPLEGGFRILLSKRWPLHLTRGLAVVVTNMAFFMGLAAMPLAEAVAIAMMAPLFITALSAPLLGERVGLQRWLAVIFGLIGVVIMIRPGSEAFQVAALFPLAAAVSYALLQIMTRKLGVGEKASTMAFYFQLTFITASAAMWVVAGDGRFASSDDPSIEFLLRAWVWPSHADMAIIVAVGAINAFGGYLLSQAYRITEVGLVAPFEYLGIPLSILWGVLIWSQWPDGYAWTGIALICGGGLYVVYRETIHGRKSAPRRRRADPATRGSP